MWKMFGRYTDVMIVYGGCAPRADPEFFLGGVVHPYTLPLDLPLCPQ